MGRASVLAVASTALIYLLSAQSLNNFLLWEMDGLGVIVGSDNATEAIAGAIEGLDDLFRSPSPTILNEEEARSEVPVEGLADLDEHFGAPAAHERGQGGDDIEGATGGMVDGPVTPALEETDDCADYAEEDEEDEEEQENEDDVVEGADMEDPRGSDDDLELPGDVIVDDELLNDVLSKRMKTHAARVAILTPSSCNEAANFVCGYLLLCFLW